ncbi:hypothetical protein MY11210_003838 [Beauveria gryllotalpidicola]
MVNPHEPLQALAPADWNDLPQDDLAAYMNHIFAQSMIVVESIPSPCSAAPPAGSGRARAKTESAAALPNDAQRSRPLRPPPASLEAAIALRKDWKEVKVNPRENPLDINVFKMSSKDGKGAWFARQSVHEGLSFDNWKVGLQREFAESLKVQGSPGMGNIRGIGADKRVEDKDIDDAGHLSVFQLSAQFPGPTSPRDFITLLLASDLAHKAKDQVGSLRQYIIVSKPCNHSQCPPRQGIIRGQYESVEIIREVHLEPSMAKRSLSAVDLAVNNGRRASSDIKMSNSERLQDPRPVAVEWLMVTRSDPGGSVPRFLIEKGTPPGIVSDAGKFLKWITAGSRRGWDEPVTATTTQKPADEVNGAEGSAPVATTETHTTTTTTTTTTAAAAAAAAATTNNLSRSDSAFQSHDEDDNSVPSSNGIYGIVTGIFGIASSVVANGLGLNYASSEESISTVQATTVQESGMESDSSSTRSFLSALEKRLSREPRAANNNNHNDASHSEDSKSTTTNPNASSAAGTPAPIGSAVEKELRKLQARRRKIDEKMMLMQERLQSKSQGDRAKDEASLAKLREKLDREAAKREQKYQRGLQKLEEKRENEARKAERRRRKAAEKEEKSSMALELERTRAELDLARQHGRILECQVRELQAQNTQLVAKLGQSTGNAPDTAAEKQT